jgi:hypothetical protein
MSLAHLQRVFWDGARGDADLAELDRLFTPKGTSSGAERLRIYNGAYYVRLERCLTEVFREVARRVGEGAFRQLARGYVKVHPSEAPAIELAGHAFARFLGESSMARQVLAAATPPVSDPAPLAELAAIEWARTRALLAPDPERVAGADQVVPERFAAATLRLVPGLELARVGPEALGLWPPTAALAVDGPRTVAFHRRGFDVRHQVLEADEADALAAVRRGDTLGVACGFFASHETPVARALTVVSSWFARGWIAAIIHPETITHTTTWTRP